MNLWIIYNRLRRNQMKVFCLSIGLMFFFYLNVGAQNIVWNISGANSSQYVEITNDELVLMFNENQLSNNRRYKIVIDSEGYLTQTSTTLSLLALMATAASGTEATSKNIYFYGAPNDYGPGKIEIYFSQAVRYDTLQVGNGSNEIIRYPVIPVDGYRLIH
jgi:hypothetical protein